MRRMMLGVVALVLIGGCGERRQEDSAAKGPEPDVGSAAGEAVGGVLRDIGTQDARDAANPYADRDDPCVLLGPADVEPVIGPLRSAPWWSGSTCHYAAVDGQRLDLDVYYSGAQIQANLMNAVNREISKGLIVNTGRGLDTLEGRWDEAHWRLGDYLETRRGDVGITVQMGNTLRADPAVAAPLADLAYARLDQPLPYDGKAVQEPPPLVAQGNACALLTRDEVVAALGALAGEPEPGGGGKTTWCSWPLAGAGRRSFTLSVTWREGFTEFNSTAAAAGIYKTNVEDPELARVGGEKEVDAAMKEMMRDSMGAKVMGAMRGMMQKGGAELRDSSLSLRSEADVKGPWARAALVHGTEFVAVRKDVYFRVDVGGVGYEKAKQLVARAAGRL
jgi:hypothetical protein